MELCPTHFVYITLGRSFMDYKHKCTDHTQVQRSYHRAAAMAQSSVRMAYILSMLLCICSLATLAMAKPKEYHITTYVYETRGGPNVTEVAAAGTGEGNLSAIGFGSFLVFDDPLRDGPEANSSKVVGELKGTAVATSLEPIYPNGGLFLTGQIVFQGNSVYNGSIITVIGTVGTAAYPYLLIVPGALGHFLGCTGYVSIVPLPATPPLVIFQWDIFLKCI